MSFDNQNMLFQASMVTQLGEIFDFIKNKSLVPTPDMPKNDVDKLLIDIGELIDFDPEYVTKSIAEMKSS